MRIKVHSSRAAVVSSEFRISKFTSRMDKLRVAVFLLGVIPLAMCLPHIAPGAIKNFMNTERRKVPSRNMHLLQWAADLARLAETHAEGCSLRKNKGLWIDRCENIGQLIDVTLIDDVNVTAQHVGNVLMNWASTGAYYDYDQNVCNDSVDCRPYTQMVWAPTIEVGCGIASCTDTKNYFLVCLFAPGGNIFGLKPYLKGKPCNDSLGPPAETCVSDLIRCNDQTLCGCPDPFEMGGGSDPHFSVRLASGQLLCFSVQGEAGSNFNLISTDDLEINALFVTLKHRKHSHRTWLGELGVAVNNRNLIFNVTSGTIQMDDKMKIEATMVEKIKLTSGKFYLQMVTGKRVGRHVEIEIPEFDVRFTIVFVGKQHLDLMWLSGTFDNRNKVHGLLGQFLRPGVKLDETRHLISLPGQAKPQAMRQKKLFQFLHTEVPQFFQSEHTCWTTMKPSEQGVGLIEGSYLDYKVPDITFNGFKFAAKSELKLEP